MELTPQLQQLSAFPRRLSDAPYARSRRGNRPSLSPWTTTESHGTARAAPRAGRDLNAEPISTDQRIKIAYVCTTHGIASVDDPFPETDT